MHVELEQGRVAFLDALTALVEVARGLDDVQLLAASRCHGWIVGDVLVHVHMGLQEMLLGVVSPSNAEPDTDAVSYWQSAVPTNDPDADDLAGIRFTRLVAAAYRRPTGAVGHLLPTVAGITTAVGAMTPRPVSFQGHVLSAGDFLATWAVELAVHHLDLGIELDTQPPAASALALTRQTIEALAGPLPAAWSDEMVALLGTGRLAPDEQQARHGGPAAQRLPVLG